MKNKYHCYGCSSEHNYCNYKEYGKDCPCIKCLVKVTCRESCEELSLFVSICQEQRRDYRRSRHESHAV